MKAKKILISSIALQNKNGQTVIKAQRFFLHRNQIISYKTSNLLHKMWTLKLFPDMNIFLASTWNLKIGSVCFCHLWNVKYLHLDEHYSTSHDIHKSCTHHLNFKFSTIIFIFQDCADFPFRPWCRKYLKYLEEEKTCHLKSLPLAAKKSL